MCGEKLLKKLKTYESICAAFIGFFVSVFLWMFSPDTAVSVSWVVIPVVLMMLSWWIVLVWRSNLGKEVEFVARIINYDPDKGRLLFFVNINSVIAIDSYITLFYKDDRGYENLYAAAVVINIQNTGVVQAKIIGAENGILENPREMIIIKPTITTRLINRILENNHE